MSEDVTIISPSWGIDTARDIIRNNERIEVALFQILTIKTWLPHVLVETDFFPSGSELKRNRPDLWRDIESGNEVIRFQWAEVSVLHVPDLTPDAEIIWMDL